MKKVFIIIVSLFIAFCPYMTLCDFSYAEESNVNPDWTFIVDAEHNIQDTLFISAFKAYLNANKTYRHFSYPYEKAIVSWSYNNLNKICSEAGLGTIEDYYDQVAVAVDNDGNFKFWYKASGLELMDNLYKAYLQHYGILSDNQEKDIYDGEYFIDNQGHGCYITEISNNARYGNTIQFDTINNIIPKLGSEYLYNNKYFNYNNLGSNNYILEYGSENLDYTITNQIEQSNDYTTDRSYLGTAVSYGMLYWHRSNDDYITNSSMVTIYKNVNPSSSLYNKYYLGTYIDYNYKTNHYFGFYLTYLLKSNEENYIDQLISLAKRGADNANLALAHNAVIDVGKMGADIGIAAVNHLTDQDENDPEVETPDDEPDVNPPRPNPPVINPNNPSNPTGVSQDPNGGFNFQMPDINIDWSLNLDVNNLPFPFSIPHDIYNAFNSLNVEAEAPHFEGTVDLVITEWDIDIDFSDYSSLANIVNKWFLFVYIVGLIIATRSLMHIY